MDSLLLAGLTAGSVLLIAGLLFGFRYRQLGIQLRQVIRKDGPQRCAVAETSLVKRGISCGDLSSEQRQQLSISLLLRDRRRTAVEATTISILLALVSGLAVYNVPSEPLAASSVVVTSRDGVSQSLSIPPTGLTLVQAVSKANLAPAAGGEELLLVAVRARQVGQAAQIYYFPLEMTLSGLPGDLPLQAGDVIRVTELDATSLGVLESQEPGIPFEVTGRVARPGKYQTGEVSEPIMNITTEEYAGSFAGDGKSAEVTVLTRQPASAGPTEHYLIPLFGPHLNRALLECRINAHDRYHYARLDELSFFRTR
jgi:hypothetical protein